MIEYIIAGFIVFFMTLFAIGSLFVKDEEEIPIEKWNGQEPSGKHCKGCAMYLWY